MRTALVVGAGLTGCSAARTLAENGMDRVDIIESRSHVAGNAYDPVHPSGIRYHLFGPHIFHTNSAKIWRFVNRFARFRPYRHQVLGMFDVGLAPIPCNFDTLHTCLGEVGRDWARRLEARFGPDSDITILQLRQEQDPTLLQIAKWVEASIFRGYSFKQWGVPIEDLDPGVVSRVPIRTGTNPYYFRDRYEGLPEPGYEALALAMIDHPNIRLELDTRVESSIFVDYNVVIYTGSTDELFDYCFGELPYRSLRFDFELIESQWYQPVAQVNFPTTEDYTRITEFKHMTGQSNTSTLIAREYAEEHRPGANDRFYPFKTDESLLLHERYKDLARTMVPNVYLAGRLGDFRYYNMDQAIARGMQSATLATRS